jgi:CheY-like chemotaxis protein
MRGELPDLKTHILVVEDNPGDVDLLRRALQAAQLECELTVIEDGAEALALARETGKYANTAPPDLAILDWNLPKHGGNEILAALRANPNFAELPVLILSSSSSPRERAQMETCRIGRFVAKPLDLDEFLRIGLIVKEMLTA